MVASIINAAPMVIDRGTQDLSTRQVPREQEPLPQHLPLVFLYTQKGPATRQLVSGANRDAIFGSDSFDLRKKWANHSTVFSNVFSAKANAQMIERIIPADAGPESNLTLWVDIKSGTVDVYDRDPLTGKILRDVNGDPATITGTTAGHTLKFTVTSHNAAYTFGSEVSGPGTIAGGSTRYPLMQFKASSQGEWGNNSGLRIWGITADSSGGANTDMMTSELAYPFRIAVINRKDASSSAKVVENIFGEQSMSLVLKPGVIDPNTDQRLYVGETFIDSYQQLDDPRYQPKFGEFGEMYTYDANIATVLNLLYGSENTYLSGTVGSYANFDFTGATGEEYLFNLFGLKSSTGAEYHTVQLDSGALAATDVVLSESTNLYAAGGSDGTMDDASFASDVETKMADYADETSSVHNLASNPVSIIYDSGFPVTTKRALCNFIAVRKDTFVVLGTHVSGQAELTASQENSLAIALRTQLLNFPESDYFGTPVMRGMIVGRSGKIRTSQWLLKTSLTYEVAAKAAAYMGASDGRWKNGYAFDGAPGSILEYMYDVNVSWTPGTVRNKDWDAGLNWVEAYDRRSLYFPALKTCYTDDTSVLNSFFTAMAICYLNKVGHMAHREFSGVSSLSNAQLVKNVNSFVTDRVANRFDNRFVVVPDAFISTMDDKRGYSWTLPIKIYAPSMKTVMTTYVQAYRDTDYAAA